MTRIPFRKKTPKRTYNGNSLNSYRKYKPFLEKDFNKRCGYSDSSQIWFGGSKNYHIDHLKPHSKYPSLKTDYSNLVYSCSYVNWSKGDDDYHYPDPCGRDYNEMLYRDSTGRIHPVSTSDEGVYIHKKLKLYLKRYSIVYMLDLLRDRQKAIKDIVETIKDGQEKKKLLELQGELANEFQDYLDYLEAEQ